MHEHEVAGLERLALQHEEADRAPDALDLALGPQTLDRAHLHRDRQTHAPIVRAVTCAERAYKYVLDSRPDRATIAPMDSGDPETPVPAQVLVLGVGNVLLRDDGVGVHVLRALEREHDGDARLKFIDGGTIGFMLAGLIEEAPDLLVIDAVRMAESPGYVRCFEDEAMDRFLTGRRGSVHEIGLRDALDMARLTGKFPRRRALIGVEPATTELGEELSAEVERGVAPAVLVAHGVIERWLSEGERRP